MQPTFLPWCGYFKLMQSCDIFVFLDNVQFDKRSWQQRNRFNINSKEHFLTVPILSKNKYYQLIKDTKIDNSQNWKLKHLKTLSHIYKSTPYFSKYFDIINKIYEKKFDLISELNICIIKTIARELNIKKKFFQSSKVLSKDHEASDRLIEIIKKLECRTYISPKGSKSYLDQNKFKYNQLELEFFEYTPKAYKQINNKKFIPNLSILDFLFNCDNNIDAI